jgi:uncharacterized protein YdaU (DUF1376 family)
MTASPWLPLYPTDYLADTRDLGPEEHGVYMLLLCESWLRGPLPDDMDRLCRLSAGAKPQAVRMILERYWTRGEDGGWRNRRLETERQVVDARRIAKAEGAAKARAIKADIKLLTKTDINSDINSDIKGESALITDTNHNHNYKYKRSTPTVCVKSPPSADVSTQAEPVEVEHKNGVPYQAIVALYHEQLAVLPRCYKLTAGRKAAIAARWREDLTDLDDWRSYFDVVAKSKLAKGFPRADGTRWKPGIDWLVRAENFAKVAEGQYG